MSEADLWAVVDAFQAERAKLMGGQEFSPQALATALETFKGLSQEQLALVLSATMSAAGGPVTIPDPLVVGTLEVTTLLTAPAPINPSDAATRGYVDTAVSAPLARAAAIETRLAAMEQRMAALEAQVRTS